MNRVASLPETRVLPNPEPLMERVPAYAEKWRTGDERDAAAVRRMFERDKDELRKYGIPLRTVTYHVNFGADEVEGYRIDRKDLYLPYLRLVAEAGGEGDGGGAAGRHGHAPIRARAGGHLTTERVDLSEAGAALALDALRRVSDRIC